MSHHSSKEQMKVYYDKDCPICSGFVVSVNSSSQKESFECRPMQNLEKEDLLSKEFHVITSDGKIYRKFDGILKIGEMYPKWRFLISIARLPIIHSIGSLGYDIFAAHRYGISKLLTRFTLMKIILILVTISTFLLSPKLWFGNRLYPQIPLLLFLKPIPSPFDFFIYLVLLILLFVSLLKLSSRRYFIVFLIIAGCYTLFDQSRLQPEFYQFFLMILALSIFPSDERSKKIMMNICAFIVASIYIYSGLQKMNVIFVEQVFPWFILPFSSFIPTGIILPIDALGIFIPFLETGIGIAFLTKRFRSYAVIVAIAMHIFILLSLGPFGHNWNTIVWPWNIAMCCFDIILFWKNDTFSFFFLSSKKLFTISIFILCGILPLLSFFNLWDSYLSASLYSGNTKSGQIRIRENTLSTLNPKVRQYISGSNGGYDIIDIGNWSYRELNVPDYPEERVFKAVAASLCHYDSHPSDIILQIRSKPNWFTGESTNKEYSCNDIE